MVTGSPNVFQTILPHFRTLIPTEMGPGGARDCAAHAAMILDSWCEDFGTPDCIIRGRLWRALQEGGSFREGYTPAEVEAVVHNCLVALENAGWKAE